MCPAGCCRPRTGLAPALLLLGAIYLIATTLPSLQKEWSDMNRASSATGVPDPALQGSRQPRTMDTRRE
jgi:hypothetical protein